MTKKFSIIEKIISITLIAWGGILLFSASRGLFNLIKLIPSEDLSLLKTFKNFHLVIFLPLLTLIAGLLLFFQKKSGWILSLIALLVNSFLLFVPTNKNTLDFSSKNTDIILAVFTIAIISLTLLLILLQKSFRLKYNSTNKTWLTIALITIVIILDKTVIFLFSKSL